MQSKASHCLSLLPSNWQRWSFIDRPGRSIGRSRSSWCEPFQTWVCCRMFTTCCTTCYSMLLVYTRNSMHFSESAPIAVKSTHFIIFQEFATRPKLVQGTAACCAFQMMTSHPWFGQQWLAQDWDTRLTAHAACSLSNLLFDFFSFTVLILFIVCSERHPARTGLAARSGADFWEGVQNRKTLIYSSPKCKRGHSVSNSRVRSLLVPLLL